MYDRVFNFSAGPAMISETVLEKARDEMMNYAGSGMSVMEMSHRSSWFKEIIEGAESSLRQLLAIPGNYKVLFLQGGASTQFYMIPLNLLNSSRKADYANTGAWSKKAIAEAKKLGDVKVVGDSSNKNFSYIPKISAADIREESSYLHITSNNTIYGTRYSYLPESPIPLVSDWSSGILSEVIDVNDYGMIYAGAQKNIGPAGLTIVIIRDDLLGINPDLPTMMDYQTHVDAASLFNTPPSYAIYIAKLVFEEILEHGGISVMEELNKRKAGMIYQAIDDSKLFKAHVESEQDRSLMNIPFFSGNEDLDKKFLQEAAEEGLVTLKGHRSVGGMRASIYNAMPIEGCEKLAKFILAFDKANS